jgi:hypothetical protein
VNISVHRTPQTENMISGRFSTTSGQTQLFVNAFPRMIVNETICITR